MCTVCGLEHLNNRNERRVQLACDCLFCGNNPMYKITKCSRCGGERIIYKCKRLRVESTFQEHYCGWICGTCGKFDSYNYNKMRLSPRGFLKIET